jgi:hypothetical protein
MKMIKGMEQREVIERGINALYKELGPAEARRFIALTHNQVHEDSVIRHRKWQAKLNKEDFFAEMRTAHLKTRKKKV